MPATTNLITHMNERSQRRKTPPTIGFELDPEWQLDELIYRQVPLQAPVSPSIPYLVPEGHDYNTEEL